MNENASGNPSNHDDDDQPVDDPRVVDELVRIHAKLLNNQSFNSGFPEATESQTADEQNHDVANRIGSAKRVMELLARMRAQTGIETIQPASEIETQPHPDTVPASLSRDEEYPQSIGRFEIRELLGQGGFGIVFRAYDPQLEREVAVKVPTAQALFNDQSRARFERECRAVARLSHPGIVPILEVGEEGIVSFLVAELVEGADLSKWIQDGGVPSPMIAASQMADVAEAVQHAHSRGVVHRDLKPANILVAQHDQPRGTGNRIRITDFGLAKFYREDQALTQSGNIVGTPAFSAPEQLFGVVEGKAAELSDVYSLGAVLFFQLTGRPPFESDSIADLLHQVRSSEPPSPAQINSDVPRDLAAICLKSMSKEPSARYQSAWEFQADLQRLLSGRSTLARPATQLEKLGKWRRRNPVVATMSLLIAIAVLVGLAATSYQWMLAKSNLREAVRQKSRSDDLLQKTEQSIDAMLNAASEELRDVPAMTDVRRKMLEDALAIQWSIYQDARNETDTWLETVESLQRMARIQQELGQFGDAKQTTQVAIQILDQSASGGDTQLKATQLWRRLVGLELETGDLDAANAAAQPLRRVTLHLDRIEAQQMPSIDLSLEATETLRVLGELAERNGRVALAAERFQRAIAVGMELTQQGLDAQQSKRCQTNMMSCWNSLGIVERAAGNLDEAHNCYIASLEINSNLLSDNPNSRVLKERSATTTFNLANLLFQRRRYQPSKARYQEAFDQFGDLKSKYPSVYKYHQRVISALSGLALIQKKSGDLKTAQATTQQAIELLEQSRKSFGDTESILYSLAFSKRALASLASAMQDYEIADDGFRLAEMATQQLVDRWPTNARYRYQLALTMGNHAGSLITRGEFATAVEKLEQAELSGETATTFAPQNATYLKSNAFIRTKLVEALVGDRQYQRALALIERTVAPESTAMDLLNVARVAAKRLANQQQVDSPANNNRSGSAVVEDRILELLESAVARGLRASEIDPKDFPVIAEQERFKQIWKSAK